MSYRHNRKICYVHRNSLLLFFEENKHKISNKEKRQIFEQCEQYRELHNKQYPKDIIRRESNSRSVDSNIRLAYNINMCDISKKFKHHNPDYESLDQSATESAAVAWGSGFYKLSRWRKLRQQAFKIYGKKCHSCGKIEEHLHVNHIKPRSKFPSLAFDITNLQVLCKKCNSEKGNHVFTDFRTPKHRGLAENLVRTQVIKREQGLCKSKKVPYGVIDHKFARLNGRTKYEFELNLKNLISSLSSNYADEVVSKSLNKHQVSIEAKIEQLSKSCERE